MFVRLIIGALLGAIIVFAWGFAFWAVLPVRFFMFKPLPHGEAIVEALKGTGDGVYVYPWAEQPTGTDEANKAALEKLMEQQKQGPLVQVSYCPEGFDPMAPLPMALGFAHFFVSAFLIGLLMVLALGGLRSYPSRVLFVFLAGLFGAVSIHLSKPIWFHEPWEHHLWFAAYSASNWLLAGIFMAIVIRPRQETAANV